MSHYQQNQEHINSVISKIKALQVPNHQEATKEDVLQTLCAVKMNMSVDSKEAAKKKEGSLITHMASENPGVSTLGDIAE